MTYTIAMRRWGTDVPGVRRPEPVWTVSPVLRALGVSRKAAEREWRGILEHKWLLSERVGRDVGLRTAVVDYFDNVRPSRAASQRTSNAGLHSTVIGPVFALERALTEFVEAVGGTRYRPL